MASIYPLRKGTKCQLYFEESYIDVQNSYSCANGSVGSTPYTLTYTGNCTVTNVGTEWKVKFLTSGILILNEKLTVDAFLVGGGGGGSIQAGGGSGYTLTKYGVNLVNGENYNIVIGTGGSGTTEAVASSAGVSTTAFGFTANPGQGTPTYFNGGAGGSGGGGGSALGGTNGDNGVCGGNNGTGGCYDGGLGQGVTTKEFFENDATLYASGGNGSSISTLQANSGNGGSKSESGSSGIVIIRNKENNVIVNGTTIGTYSGNFEVVEDNNNWKVRFLSSASFIPKENISIDIFAVGGGGGGALQAGGGGGYTQTSLNYSLTKDTEYQIVIGTGGAANFSSSASTAGIATTAFGLTANPGQGTPTYFNGGAGGSGGGGGSANGGSDGGNGICGGDNGVGGCYSGELDKEQQQENSQS